MIHYHEELLFVDSPKVSSTVKKWFSKSSLLVFPSGRWKHCLRFSNVLFREHSIFLCLVLSRTPLLRCLLLLASYWITLLKIRHIFTWSEATLCTFVNLVNYDMHFFESLFANQILLRNTLSYDVCFLVAKKLVNCWVISTYFYKRYKNLQLLEANFFTNVAMCKISTYKLKLILFKFVI